MNNWPSKIQTDAQRWFTEEHEFEEKVNMKDSIFNKDWLIFLDILLFLVSSLLSKHINKQRLEV